MRNWYVMFWLSRDVSDWQRIEGSQAACRVVFHAMTAHKFVLVHLLDPDHKVMQVAELKEI